MPEVPASQLPASQLPGRRRTDFVMGMPITVDVRDDLADEALLDRVFDWFREVDARFSTYKADSEISRLNRDELALRECSDDVRLVIARCRELTGETGGYFDAEAAERGTLDPSGLVKGWSVDRAAALLDAAGAANYSVNAGGDIRLRGDALPLARWRVGIRHPIVHEALAAVVEGDDLAVATSGAYVRGDHVLDPHTGRPPRGVLSVTITGPDLATADAYATAAFAMGGAGPEWTRGLAPYEAMTITDDERVLSTPGFPLVREADVSADV
jgi:thiamine biosynthesis lipoprotein